MIKLIVFIVCKSVIFDDLWCLFYGLFCVDNKGIIIFGKKEKRRNKEMDKGCLIFVI